MPGWLKVILWIIAGFVLLILGVYLYLFPFDGLESIVNAELDDRVADESRYDITVGEISGNLISGIVVQDITVDYRDTTGNIIRVAEVASITAGYSLSNIFDGRYHFSYLYIDSADIRMITDSAGQMTPAIPGGGGGGDTQPPAFAVDDLFLRDCKLTVIQPEDTIKVSDFTLSAALQTENGSYAADVKQLRLKSNLRDVAITAAGGQLTFSENTLVFNNLNLVSGSVRFKANGTISVDDMSGRLEFSTDQLDLQSISQYVGPSLEGVVDINANIQFDSTGIAGSVNVGGQFMMVDIENLFVDFNFANNALALDTLYGTILGNCTVDGAGLIDFNSDPDTYEARIDVKNFNLKSLLDNTFESDLTGTFDIEGSSFSSDELRLTINTEVVESSFDEYPLQYARGELIVTTDSIYMPDSFRVDYFENQLYATGAVSFSDGMDLVIVANLQNLDRYEDKFFLAEIGGRAKARAVLDGATSDPNLSGEFWSDSLWLYDLYADTAHASWNLQRFLTGREGSVETWFSSGDAWGTAYDTVFAQLTLDSTLAYIDTVDFRSEQAHLTTIGVLDYGATPQELVLDSIEIDVLDRKFVSDDDLEILIDSLGFQLSQFTVQTRNASVTVAGRMNYDLTVDAALSLERVQIRPWLVLFDQQLLLDGFLSCDLDLSGSFDEPQFALDASIDSLSYQDLLLGHLTSRFSYDDLVLSIDTFAVESDSGFYRMRGTLPVNLALTADSLDRLPERPMDIDIKATDSKFDLISLLMPSIEELRGNLYADIELTGTTREPHLDGFAYITNVELKYFDLANRLYSDSAGVQFRDNQIQIDRIVARSSDGDKRKGRAVIQGTVTVKQLDLLSYDLTVRLEDNFPFEYDLDDISGVATGRLQVQGDAPPTVTGDLTLKRMMYQVPFTSQDELGPMAASLQDDESWDLNIRIDIPSDYWIKNQDLDAELRGFINVIREDGQMRMIGDMVFIRGRGYLFDKTFNIDEGSSVQFVGGETINPQLDITARTRMPGGAFAEEDAPRSEQELVIHIGGTLEAPDIQSRTPGVSNADLLPFLVTNAYGGQTTGGGQFGQRAAAMLAPLASQVLNRELSDLGLGVQFDPGYGTEGGLLDTRVTVGLTPAFSRDLYIYGRSTLSGQSGQEVGFEYRFDRWLILEGLRDEDELYHLNINLHFEFGKDDDR